MHKRSSLKPQTNRSNGGRSWQKILVQEKDCAYKGSSQQTNSKDPTKLFHKKKELRVVRNGTKPIISYKDKNKDKTINS